MRKGWETHALGDIADVSWGDTKTTKSSYVTTGYQAFSASGPDGFLDHYDYDQDGVVVSAIGAQCGKTWFATGKWSCIKNTIRILPRDGVADARFLFYATCGLATFVSRGSAQPFIAQADARATRVLVPPLEEQCRIAGVLGALDDLIETNQRLISSLVCQADAIALQHRLHSAGDLRTFGSVAKVSGGGTPSTKSPEFWGGSICWATPTDMTALPSPYLFGTSRTITQAGLDACSSELFPEGSILMTSRATIGPSAVTQVPTAINQGFIVLEPLLDIDRWFLFHEMRRRVPEFIARANGSTFMEISRGVFKSLEVEWPDTEARSRLHGWLEPLHAAAAALQREVADLSRSRDELLPLLVSGRVSVREVAA